jgi:cytochrome P450
MWGTAVLDLFSDPVRRNPFPLYAQLRATQPVFEVPGSGMWMLFDYASVKQALTDTTAFSSKHRTPGGPSPDWMIFNDAPRHPRLRGLVLRAFTPRVVAALEPRIAEISQALLAPALAKGEFDLIGEFAEPLPVTVIAEILGVSTAERARYLSWVDAISRLAGLVSGETPEEAGRAYAAVREDMAAYVDQALAERRARPREDLLSRLLAADDGAEPLSGEDIFGFFQLLIFAGTETTVNLIGNAVICLMDQPAALAEVRADPTLIPQMLEEVLRFRPSAIFTFREARRDVEIGGRTIPKGALVLPVVAAANRDPAVFANPEVFDIHREPNPHLAFGHGAHFCLGAALARLEGRIALGQLLAQAPDLVLAQSEPWTPRPGSLVHGAASLKFRTARTAAPAMA